MAKKNKAGLRLLQIGFLALLLLPWPLWGLLHGALDTTNHENRTLAAFPSVAETGLNAWPAAFEDWLGDHAPFRNQLMTLNTGVNRLTGTLDSGDVLRGQNGWLFLKDASDSQSISDYQGLTACTGKELTDTAASLTALQAALEARGSTLAVLFAPAKEEVYSRYMPADIPVVSRPTRVEGLVAALRAQTEVPVVFPQEALTDASRTQQVYYKYDTHWNAVGAWLAAQQTLAALGLPCGTALPAVQADAGRQATHDLADISASWAFCGDDAYYQPGAPAANLDQSPNGELQHYTGSGSQSLLLVRDSFGDALAPWLCEPFGEALVIHGNELNLKNLNAEQKTLPDVVVLEVAERFYYNLPGRAATVLDWVESLS